MVNEKIIIIAIQIKLLIIIMIMIMKVIIVINNISLTWCKIDNGEMKYGMCM